MPLPADARRNKNDPNIVLDPSNPTRIARTFIAKHALDGHNTLRWYAGSFYEWENGQYSKIDTDTVRSVIRGFLDRALKPSMPKNSTTPIEVPFQPKTRDIDEVLAALKDAVLVPSTVTPAAWLDDEPERPPPSELLACRNGLLNITTDELLPSSPLFFNTSALPIAYESDAPEPRCWLKFLRELWGNDEESIQTLQDWFGYCLTSETRQQKMLLIVGPPRSGKGTIAHVLTGLLGESNVAGPTLGSFRTNFGLWPLIGKPLAIIPDARLSRRGDHTPVVERLLSISGEDRLTIDRKYREHVTVKLSTRLMILTNEMPAFTDSSAALARRFIILRLTESFYGREDQQLAGRLLAELPGILLWAIDGWSRLQGRGHFVQPKSAAETVLQLQELGSPILAFVEDRCVVDQKRQVQKKALYQAYREWCVERDEEPLSHPHFGSGLSAALPGLRESRPRDFFGDRMRVYVGVGLNNVPGPPRSRDQLTVGPPETELDKEKVTTRTGLDHDDREGTEL